MSEYDRYVFFCQFSMYDTVRKYKNVKGAPVKIDSKLNLESFYKHVKSVFDEDRAFKHFSNDKKELRVQDIAEMGDSYSFLINYTEADGSHHASRDIAEGERKSMQYEPTEGPEHSAHVIIYKAIEGGTHLMLIEKMSGFPITKAIVFFNAMLRSAVALAKRQAQNVKGMVNPFVHNHPISERDSKGKVKKVVYRPHVSIDAVINPSFFDAMSKGSISDIELISDEPASAGMDFPDNFKSWVVKIDKEPATDNLRDYIPRVLTQGRDFKMHRLKVRFTDEHNVSKTQNFELDGLSDTSSDLFGDNCILIKRLVLSSRPYASYESLDENIIEAMKGLVENEKT
ncbi:hypothetical protein KDX00_03250 [Cobetia amphilecti]|nr:hypothetical protein KDX00_03250 [Cobetia litoralis]